MKQKKIYEQKFRDSATAVDALDAAGFEYLGQHGLFKKHHRYTGKLVSHSSPSEINVHSLEVQLYSDGHVKIYIDSSTSSLLGLGSFPIKVYPSAESYLQEIKGFQEVNRELMDHFGGKLYLKLVSRDKCEVHEYLLHQPTGKKMFGGAQLASFPNWTDALEWARLESKRRG